MQAPKHADKQVRTVQDGSYMEEEETTSKDAVMTPCTPTLNTTAATDLRTQWCRGKKGKYQSLCVHPFNRI